MLTVTEALIAILEHSQPGQPQQVPLADCLRRVLADDLSTPHDSPPFDKSMMDGFVVSCSAFADQEIATLQVLETITAGTIPTASVAGDAASRIMTGAPIPSGGDCVIPIERVQFDERQPDVVTIPGDVVMAERHILRQGCLAKTGDPLLPRGTVIEPQHIAVLAEFGVAQLPVYLKPTVAVLATGDELLPIDQPLTPGHIRNSNEPMLVSQIQRAGAEAVPLGVARDNRAELSVRIADGLKCDFLLLSGGVSAGTLDLVPSELAAAGVEEVFHKIQMKPGKPLWFGQRTVNGHKCCVFGLPGNPVSSMICFEIFVRSALRAFCGETNAEPQTVEAALTEDVAIRGDRPTYFPATLNRHKGQMTATTVRWGGSADLRSTADANGMVILHPRTEPYKAGETVSAIEW